MNNQDQQAQIEQKQKQYRAKAFRVALELIFVFGAPAFLAYFAGQHLDATYQTGKTITFILLVLAFISSWVVVIVRTRSLGNQFKESEKELRNLKDQQEKRKKEQLAEYIEDEE